MWRSIFMNFRPVAVWATDLALFYGVTAGRFGEAWAAWSWLQLAGMAVLLLGTAVYNGSLRVPGLAPAARAGGADASGPQQQPCSPLVSRGVEDAESVTAALSPKQASREGARLLVGGGPERAGYASLRSVHVQEPRGRSGSS